MRRTPMDFGVLLFLASAVLSYWVAYDRIEAWSRLCLITLAVMAFYVIEQMPRRLLWYLVEILAVMGAGVGLLFLFSHDFRLQPAEFGWINALGIFWSDLVPDVNLPPIPPNIAGGTVAMLVPLALLLFYRARQGRNRHLLLWRSLILIVMMVSLLLTSSRGAWTALLSGAVVGLIFYWLRQRGKKLPRIVLPVGAIIFVLAITGWVVASKSPELVSNLDTWIPGSSSAQSRAALVGNSIKLMEDVPFSGVGLDGFAANYSRYILVVSEFYFGYAHNLYLDLALSQSLLGLLSFLVVCYAALHFIFKALDTGIEKIDDFHQLQAVTLSVLTIVLLHGFFDDPLYSSRGVVLLFVFPAISLALHREERTIRQAHESEAKPARSRLRVWHLGAGLVAGFMLLVLIIPSVNSRFRTNMAVVSLARSELAGWPEGVVFDLVRYPGDGKLEANLVRSLELEPENRTAYHRLGLLYLRHGEFERAIENLVTARSIDPGHIGIKKTLAYAYVWQGDPYRARDLLLDFPETVYELELYSSWWRSRGRLDLANRAGEMHSILEQTQLPITTDG